MLKRIVELLLLSIILFLSSVVVSYTLIGKFTENEIQLDDDEYQVYDMINTYREEQGLRKLELDNRLNKIAKTKAKDLSEGYYFDHTSPKYGTIFDMMKREHIYYETAGENLAGNVDCEKAVKAWLNSDTHRENIEDDFTYTGVAVQNSKLYGKIYVQIFIK